MLIGVHSFAMAMEKAFKYIGTMVLLLILSSTSLFARDVSHVLLRNTADEKAFDTFYAKNLSDSEYSFYTATPLSNEQFIKKGFISENDEEDVENADAKKTSAISKCASGHCKQQLDSIASLSEKCTPPYSPIFFQSKTASSLYLLFKVFRI